MPFFPNEKLDELTKKDLFPRFVCRDLIIQSKALNHAWAEVYKMNELIDAHVEKPIDADRAKLLEVWGRIKTLKAELDGINSGVPLK